MDEWEEMIAQANGLPEPHRTHVLEHARATLLRSSYRSAGHLACTLEPAKNWQTPALEMIDDALEWAFTTPGARLRISKPSQTGKSSRAAVWGAVRAFQVLGPDTRIIIATYSEDLARIHSEDIRRILATHGTGARDAQTGQPLPDKIGVGLGDKNSATRWNVSNGRGGVIAVGTGGSLAGRPADLLILDDLERDMDAADSDAEQRRLRGWWDSAASQRLGPNAPVIMIGTRYGEKDIQSYIYGQDPDRWRVLNFPAIAEPGILDSLNRQPGELLANPRNHDWIHKRATVPERTWYTMYQGHPIPLAGGLIKAKWFHTHRVPTAPPPTRLIVAVDPAETAKGDEAGVVVASRDAFGTVYILDDRSAKLTSAEWATAACRAARDHGASEIVVEGYTTKETYLRIVKQTWRALYPDVRQPIVTAWHETGDAIARSAGLREALEVGRCRLVGEHTVFESQAVRWMPGQHQPDRLAAATIAYDVLAKHTPAQIGSSGGGWGVLPSGLGHERLG